MRLRLALLAAAAALTAVPATAGAAGVTTHAYMADEAVKHVRTPELRTLLRAQQAHLLAGAAYPDGGYAVGSLPGGDFGEVSHWERFVNAYVARLRGKQGCGSLTAPYGPCAALVAHAFGAAAHGMGDELWDWLFEPSMADHHESPQHPLVRAGLPGMAELAAAPLVEQINTSEYVMDLVGIVEWARALHLPLTLPPVDELVRTYRDLGRDDISAAGILAGHGAITGVLVAERVAALVDYARVKQTMPRSAARYFDGQGGVADVARTIAGYYEALWAKLQGVRPAPQVVGVNPEPGATGVPTAFWPQRSAPGPSGGGAALRVLATLSTSLQRAPLPAGSLRLFGPGGVEVPQQEGWPRPGPYGDGDGTHTLMLYPATDLAPCTTYTAEVGTALRDHAGSTPAEPYRWSFTTQCGAPAPAPAASKSVLGGVLSGVRRLLGG